MTTAAGSEVVRVRTAADGSFAIALPVGDFVLVPQPVEGLLGTADRVSLSVPANGPPAPALLEIEYDTGIR